MTKTLTIRFETDLDVTSELQREAKNLVIDALLEWQMTRAQAGVYVGPEQQALLNAMLDTRVEPEIPTTGKGSPQVEMTSEFRDAWATVLDGYAAELNFDVPDHRADFRMAVSRGTAQLRCSGIRELARHYGAVNVPTSRDGAARALADAYMAGRYAKSPGRCRAHVACPNCGGDGFSQEGGDCPACFGAERVRCARKAVTFITVGHDTTRWLCQPCYDHEAGNSCR